MKTHFRKVDAAIVPAGPPEGKRRTIEKFFVEVEEGARATGHVSKRHFLSSLVIRDAEVYGMYINYLLF